MWWKVSEPLKPQSLLTDSLWTSISGLWSALVASDHFEDVLIIDPEAWLATDEGRSNLYDCDGLLAQSSKKSVRTRVMQYQAIHG